MLTCNRAGVCVVRVCAAMRHVSSTPPAPQADGGNPLFTMVSCPASVQRARRILGGAPRGSFLAIDCEGVDLPETLCLVQVALVPPPTQEGALSMHRQAPPHVFLFDTINHPHREAVLLCLREVCGDIYTTKLLHSCQSDLKALTKHGGVEMAGPLVDTQIAAGLLEATPNTHSLNTVQARYGLAVKPKVHWTFHKGWAQRPLSAQHVAYACGDVVDLPYIWMQQLAEAEKNGDVERFKAKALVSPSSRSAAAVAAAVVAGAADARAARKVLPADSQCHVQK